MLFQENRIAFFDSGIGGLTTLFSCEQYLHARLDVSRFPSFYYYGDNFRAPYGNLPNEKIFEYVDEAFSLFACRNVTVAVIACNTATAVCIDKLKEKYPFKIIGIEPAVISAAKNGGEVYVLATTATCRSDRFKRLCERAEKQYPDCILKVISCPQLAGEIERNFGQKNYDFTKFFPKGNPAGVVLGCTHYSYLKKDFERFYRCPIYDGNEKVARKLYAILSKTSSNSLEDEKNERGDRYPNSRSLIDKKCFEKDGIIQTSTNFCGFWDENPFATTQKTVFLGQAAGVNQTKYEQMFG